MPNCESWGIIEVAEKDSRLYFTIVAIFQMGTDVLSRKEAILMNFGVSSWKI
jgi:hypothetical protein